MWQDVSCTILARRAGCGHDETCQPNESILARPCCTAATNAPSHSTAGPSRARSEDLAQAIFSSASRFGRTFTCAAGTAPVTAKSGSLVLRSAGTPRGMPERLTRLATIGAFAMGVRRSTIAISPHCSFTQTPGGYTPSVRISACPASSVWPPSSSSATCAAAVGDDAGRLLRGVSHRAGRRRGVMAHGVQPHRVVDADLGQQRGGALGMVAQRALLHLAE